MGKIGIRLGKPDETGRAKGEQPGPGVVYLNSGSNQVRPREKHGCQGW